MISAGRKVAYAAEKKKAMKRFMNGCAIIPGIAWREVGLLYDGKEIMPEDIGSVRQELDLYEGTAESGI